LTIAPPARSRIASAAAWAQKNAPLEVHVEQPVPVTLLHLEGGTALEQARVVDPDVDAPEGADRGVDETRASLTLPEVGRVPGRLPPSAATPRRPRGQRPRLDR
jgi:hypothetical protein